MFSISHTNNQKRIAVIEIGSFREEFQSDGDLSPAALDDLWFEQLKSLSHKNSVVLPCRIQNGIISRGWVIWKEKQQAYIQDMLFPDGRRLGDDPVPERETQTEDGYGISEWSIDMECIEKFLKK